MVYSQKVSTTNPHLSTLIIDDSGSMALILEGTSDEKYKLVENYVISIIRMLLARCQTPENDIRPRYFMDILSYGTSAEVWNNNHEPLSIGDIVNVLKDNDFSLNLGGFLERTDTEKAFKLALERLDSAMNTGKFDNSFPPIVFHLTDGESHTDPEEIADKIRGITIKDGNVLLLNAYIGTETDLYYNGPEDFVGYVDESDVGNNKYNLLLFRMSSIIPESIRENLIRADIFPSIRKNSRLFFDVRTKDMLKNVIQVVGSVEAGKGNLDRKNR